MWNGTNDWSLLGGLNFDAPILNYNNHGERNWWPLMHLAPDGRIFHSGPTPKMHMIDVNGSGTINETNTHTAWYPKQLQELTRPENQRPFDPQIAPGLYADGPMPTSPILALDEEAIDGISPIRLPDDLTVGLASLAVTYPSGMTLVPPLAI